jgi:cytoskeletal protein RodZ
MKRCPQCEFIYNDDQNLCDMDGRDLVHDDALASLPDNSLLVNDLQRRKSGFRVLTVPALAGLLLAAVIWLGYYAAPRLMAKPETRPSSQSQKLQNSPAPKTAPVANEPSQPTSEPAKSPEASKPIGDSIDPAQPASPIQRSPSTAAVKPDERLTISRRLPSLRRIPPLPRLPAAKVRRTTSANSVPAREDRTEVTAVKQDSGVKSFLKKTGRILKKPFKL